jgi:hypothetical protein
VSHARVCARRRCPAAAAAADAATRADAEAAAATGVFTGVEGGSPVGLFPPSPSASPGASGGASGGSSFGGGGSDVALSPAGAVTRALIDRLRAAVRSWRWAPAADALEALVACGVDAALVRAAADYSASAADAAGALLCAGASPVAAVGALDAGAAEGGGDGDGAAASSGSGGARGALYSVTGASALGVRVARGGAGGLSCVCVTRAREKCA